MPPEKRRHILRAIFAKAREHQLAMRGVQRYIKSADNLVGGTEDLFKKKYPQTRAWLKVGGTVAGVPNQFIRAAASAERAANEAKKARLMAEAGRQGAELVAKGLPFPSPGRGRPGPGTLIPPKEAGYVKWTGKGEHHGMWVPPALHEQLTAAVKVGRKPKIKKQHRQKIKAALKAQAAAQKAMKTAPATEEKLRRVLDLRKPKKS